MTIKQTIYKTLKYPFFGRFMVKWRNPIPEPERNEWKSVKVKSKSEGQIRGLLAFAKTASPKATIVLGHPMGKEAKGYFIKRGYTDMLRENGYNTLIFDINGFGESSHGNFSCFEDIISVGLAAQKLIPELPVGYFGISLGGHWATIAFADADHPYKFAIVESAATTLDEFWVRFPFAHKSLQIFNVLLPKFKKRINMVERIKEAKNLQSLLLIYSQSDEWVALEMGERFKANSPIATELWTVEKATHAEISKSAYRDVYFEKIVAYFDGAVRYSV